MAISADTARAMSQENLRKMRASWDAWLRGDMEGVLAHYAPDAVWDMSHFGDWPEPEYIGHRGIRQFLTEWLDVWDAYEVGVEDFVSVPDGRVITLAWQRGRGRHSGLPMDMKWAMLATFRNGKIVRIENYDDRADALEAVGLSE